MTPRSYDITSTEMHLRRKLAEATRKADQLAQDAAGADHIAALEAKVAALEARLKGEDALRISCDDLAAENRRLKAAAKEQKAEIARLKADLALAYQMERDARRECERHEKARFGWAEKSRALTATLAEALAQNRILKARLSRSSQNSSMPPSSDTNVKRDICNSREKTGRKPGAQPGHEGHKRKARVPDEVVYLKPLDVCPECSGTLEPDGTVRTRQLTDLVITANTIEYVAEGHRCVCCGKQVFSPFPEGVENEVNFGNNIRAITTFLYNGCNISKAKTASFVFEATGGELALSEGSVHNFLANFSEKAQGAISDVAHDIKAAGIIGSDATHTRSEGKRSYVYSFNTQDSAVYQASAHKGLGPLNDSLLKGYGGTIVHDHDTSYYNFGSRHAECNVHILRYLKGVCQNEPDVKWALEMRALLCEANDLCKAARAAGAEALDDGIIAGIEVRFDDIIATAEGEYADVASLPAKYRPEGVALCKRLKEFKCGHLLFIHDLSVPFDNNQSERSHRCVKQKTKQIGGFRSTANGEALYCDYLSVTQTARLRKMGILKTVRDIFDGNSEMFKVANPPPIQA
jgi:transposase